MEFPGFIGPSNMLASVVAGVERTVNLYMERRAEGWWLKPAPGYSVFCTLPTGPVRALFHQDGKAYAVGGDRFYEIFSDGTFVQRGVMNADTRRATIDINSAKEVYVVSGMGGYIHNQNTLAFTTITAPGFPAAAISGAFADQYFLALASGSPQFSRSGLNNGLSWNALHVSPKSKTTDNLLQMVYDSVDLHLFGSKTIESWFNSGDPNDPWSPRPTIIEGGIAAPDSVTKGGGSVFWLLGNEAGARTVVRMSGYGAMPIGSDAVHTAIRGYSRVDDADGWYYEEDGHGFYVLSFPTAKATWVYDVTTKLWHERGYWNTTTGEYEADRGRCHTSAFDKHLVGSRVDGTVFVMSPTAKTYAGGVIRRLRRAPHVNANGKEIFHRRLELLMEVGVGTVAGQGTDPQIFLRISDDGGKTFGSERWARLGPLDQFKRRVFWHGLGRSRNRVYEVVVSDPVFVGIVGAELDAIGGLH